MLLLLEPHCFPQRGIAAALKIKNRIQFFNAVKGTT